MMTKKYYLDDRFFVSNQNFTTLHVKVVKNSRFFCLNCQIPDFSMFFQVKWQPCNLNKRFILMYDIWIIISYIVLYNKLLKIKNLSFTYLLNHLINFKPLQTENVY